LEYENSTHPLVLMIWFRCRTSESFELYYDFLVLTIPYDKKFE